MKELLEGVWTWSSWKAGSFRGVAFNGYSLVLGDERVVVDPPPLNDWDVEHLMALGAPTQVVVTNAHHLRAAVAVCDRFGAALHVPAADAEAIACEGASEFGDGDELFGLRVIGLVDQKTAGESALYWPGRKLLIVGDALIGTPAGSLTMLPAKKFADVGAARAGLARLAELDVEVLLPGDGEPILSRASEALRLFLEGGTPAAPLEQAGGGLAPAGPGWFVLNVGEARWLGSEAFGSYALFESERAPFREIGVNVTVLQPGQPASRYHRESTQEGFLVLSGTCTLIIEETERTLRPWDYVHCPPGTAHVFVGAGDGPCSILMMGARTPQSLIEYPVSALAGRHGASVGRTTDSPAEAYEGCSSPSDIEPAWRGPGACTDPAEA